MSFKCHACIQNCLRGWYIASRPKLPAIVRKKPTTRRVRPIDYALKLIRDSNFTAREAADLITALELKCKESTDEFTEKASSLLLSALEEMQKTSDADAFSEQLIEDLRLGKPQVIRMPRLLA